MTAEEGENVVSPVPFHVIGLERDPTSSKSARVLPPVKEPLMNELLSVSMVVGALKTMLEFCEESILPAFS